MRVSTYGGFSIEEVPVFSPEECGRVVEAVEALREHWIQRQPEVPFYSLGASNSYDIPNLDPPPYYDLAAKLNPILLRELDWFYERFRGAVEEHLGADTVFANQLAVPGFHIVEPHASLESIEPVTHLQWFMERQLAPKGQSPVHADIPQYLVDWEDEGAMDFSEPRSFTLPVTIPEGGTGMYVWDLSLEESEGMNEASLRQAYREREKWTHRYRLGEMAVHDGTYHHQALPYAESVTEVPRITLQGHGLKRDGVWQLYW